MEPMDVISAFAAITVPIVTTVLLSSRQTQRIIQTTSTQTHRILGKLERCLVKIDRTQRNVQKVQQNMCRCLLKISRTQRDMHRCLLKLDLGFRANAAMHGWERRDGLTSAQIRELPSPKVYDEELGICYFKPD
jgi:hypothetical protein